MKSIVLLSVSIFFFLAWPAHCTERPETFRVAVAGEVLAGPVSYQEQFFIITADWSVKALSGDGSIRWRRQLQGRPRPFLTVAPWGQVFTVSGTGFLESWSTDGFFLWRVQLAGQPIFSPHSGRDGRIFLVEAGAVECRSHLGLRKWRVSLPARPALPPSETGDGDLLLFLTDSTLVRISPWGEILERISMPPGLTTLASVTGGFLAGFFDGRTMYFEVRPGRDTTAVWQFSADHGVVALHSFEFWTLVLTADGGLTVLNTTDGAVQEGLFFGIPASAGARLDSSHERYTVVSTVGTAAVTHTGRVLWSLRFPSEPVAVVLSPEGLVAAAFRDWTVAGWKLEVPIRDSKKKRPKPIFYGILEGRSPEAGTPLATDRQLIRSLFSSVASDLEAGDTGTAELWYGRRCAELLSGTPLSRFPSRDLDSTERSRAAHLLGQLGSFEYRSLLTAIARTEQDKTVLAGVLSALAALAFDPDGEILEAVALVIHRSGLSGTLTVRSASDVLYALARFNSGDVQRSAASLLLDLTRTPWPEPVREHAMHYMMNLLQ